MANEENNSSRPDMSDSEDFDVIEENIMKILVASNLNLGYEQTVKRDQEDDSFRTFEEILQYARDYEVDAILLGGNLFYESSPPLSVITKCISLLRKYCLSQKCVKIQCLTDPEWIFSHCPHKIVNFDDPDLNIGMPIFSIYGHRDASIFGPAGSLDLLAATGLINYFGKWTADDDIMIPPLLLRKGLTTVALYGLNHMNDKKLLKYIKFDKFKLLQEESLSNVFSIMVLHQNRPRRGRAEGTFISETLLPDFLDLVIWGHEPVCRIKHERVPNKSFHISQPGSTVVTSLTRGEAVRKQVAILNIYKESFEMKYLKLKTVRPFVFDRLSLSENAATIRNLQKIMIFGRPTVRSKKEAVHDFIIKHIDETLMPMVEEQMTGHPRQPKKPLLRLKLHCDEGLDRYQLVRKLTRKYEEIVANPADMISFVDEGMDVLELESDDDYEDLSSLYFENEPREWSRTVENGMAEHFNREENKRNLKVLSVKKLNKALVKFKNCDYRAFDRTVRKQMRRTVERLLNDDVAVEDAADAVDAYCEERVAAEAQQTRRSVERLLNDDVAVEEDAADDVEEYCEEILVAEDQ